MSLTYQSSWIASCSVIVQNTVDLLTVESVSIIIYIGIVYRKLNFESMKKPLQNVSVTPFPLKRSVTQTIHKLIIVHQRCDVSNQLHDITKTTNARKRSK